MNLCQYHKHNLGVMAVDHRERGTVFTHVDKGELDWWSSWHPWAGVLQAKLLVSLWGHQHVDKQGFKHLLCSTYRCLRTNFSLWQEFYWLGRWLETHVFIVINAIQLSLVAIYAFTKHARAWESRDGRCRLFRFYYKRNMIWTQFPSKKSPTPSLIWWELLWLGSRRTSLRPLHISSFLQTPHVCRNCFQSCSLGLIEAGHHCLVQCLLVGFCWGDPIGTAPGTQARTSNPCLGLCKKGRFVRLVEVHWKCWE